MRRQHTCDGYREAVDDDLATDDCGVAGEALLPIAIAEDHGPRAGGLVIFGEDRAADERLHAEASEVIAGDEMSVGIFARATRGNRELALGITDEVRELRY